MTLYIQHGHGKSDKITNAIDDQSANGIIFAARNEKIEKLDQCLADLVASYDNLDLLFDPQFFISILSPANDRYMDEYPFYQPTRGAGDFVGAKKIAGYVKQTIDFQHARPFTRLLSPTVIVKSFADRWSQIALQLADSSIEYVNELDDPSPLLVKVMLAESALDDRSELDSFLDIITGWEVHGFQIVIVRDDPTYNQEIDPDRFAHLLYMIYVLGDRNGFEVVIGYCDFIGIPCVAAGATAFGNGWYQSLRQFHVKAFLKRKPGGARALLRYSSSKLFNSIRLSELESIFEAGHLEDVLSGVQLDDLIRSAESPAASNWSTAISEQHHWQTLAALDQSLDGNVKQRIADTTRKIRQAQGLFTLLQAEGVPFERGNQQGQHYKDLLLGMQRFVSIAGI